MLFNANGFLSVRTFFMRNAKQLSVLMALLFTCTLLRAQIRIACVGNSITYGMGVENREKNSYPAQLQAMLGSGYQVLNYGVSGTTLLRKGNRPYWATEQYNQSLSSNPNIVLIKLGTNDSKAANRPFHAELKTDLTTMVNRYRQLPTKPRVILLLPVPSFVKDSNDIYDPVIKNAIHPAIKEVAFELGLELIDLHQLLIDKPDMFPDNVHPTSLGATVMAKRIYEYLTLKEGNPPAWGMLIRPGVPQVNFHGYVQHNLTWENRMVHIVEPKRYAAGRPWVWRARFWGHEPQVDIALLERGFHIVYCDVAELFGNREAIDIWNRFYDLMVKFGLSKKAVLEGMSRGGVYVYNWALANPDKVACIYVDNPVLDLKSWPGGIGKGKASAADWAQFKKVYQLSDAAAKSFKGSPLDSAEKIASLKIPLLHVVGDKDDVVPLAENTKPFEERIRKAGGQIEVIHKPQGKHHPHCLPNPTPIVDFILRHTGQKTNFALIPAPGSEYRSGAGWTEGAEWWKQFQSIDSLLKAKAPLDIIFLGNSITQGIGTDRPYVTHKPGASAFEKAFQGFNWVTAGISGDRTQHILWRLQHGAYREASPRFLVLTIGVNNMPDDSAEEIAEGILACAQWIRSNMPSTKLILTGPLPAGVEKTDVKRVKYEAIHEQLSKRRIDGVNYLPIHKPFISGDGRLDLKLVSTDGIHLEAAGYAAWARVLENVIKG
jgi:lysophospholipase L1-like esterase/pimeloyl-ACP methyl ester carboxylesterase